MNLLFQEFSSVRQFVANKNYDVAVCKASGIARLLHDDASKQLKTRLKRIARNTESTHNRANI